MSVYVSGVCLSVCRPSDRPYVRSFFRMYVYECVCVREYVYVCVCPCVRAYVFACIRVGVHSCLYVWLAVCLSVPCVCVRTYIHACGCACKHLCMAF